MADHAQPVGFVVEGFLDVADGGLPSAVVVVLGGEVDRLGARCGGGEGALHPESGGRIGVAPQV